MQLESIEIGREQVWCDGGGGPLGHPRVYLHILSESGDAICPYCSRTFRREQTSPPAQL